MIENQTTSFNQVQFICVAISTTPANLASIDDYCDGKKYARYNDEYNMLTLKETLSVIKRQLHL